VVRWCRGSWQFNIFIIFYFNFLKDYKFHNLKSAPFCSVGRAKCMSMTTMYAWIGACSSRSLLEQTKLFALCSPRFAQSPFYLLTLLNFKIKMKKKKLFL
jgi:hypothetical protein